MVGHLQLVGAVDTGSVDKSVPEQNFYQYRRSPSLKDPESIEALAVWK